MSEPEGTVFDIQRYSIHDGPGIRTVVFLKGCPLRCLWCSNPEGQRAGPELEFFSLRCRRCGRCVESCPRKAINPDRACAPGDKIVRSECDLCGRCVEACPNSALEMTGRRMTTEQVVAEVKKDATFYRRSGGGVTLSGGDSLAQPAFASSILRSCVDANIHTALETTGYAPPGIFLEMARLTDLVLFDLKQMDPAEHLRLTGVPNDRILGNLRALVELGKPVTVRMPLIPGLNDDEANVKSTGAYACGLGIRQIHLMPFHQLGKDKYTRLGLSYELRDLPPLTTAGSGAESVARARSILEAIGLEVQIGG